MFPNLAEENLSKLGFVAANAAAADNRNNGAQSSDWIESFWLLPASASQSTASAQLAGPEEPSATAATATASARSH